MGTRDRRRIGDFFGDEDIMVNGGLLAGMELQHSIENKPLAFGHATVEKEVLLPGRRDRFESEIGTVGETFVESNA
jgi:hypothetical protein